MKRLDLNKLIEIYPRAELERYIGFHAITSEKMIRKSLKNDSPPSVREPSYVYYRNDVVAEPLTQLTYIKKQDYSFKSLKLKFHFESSILKQPELPENFLPPNVIEFKEDVAFGILSGTIKIATALANKSITISGAVSDLERFTEMIKIILPVSKDLHAPSTPQENFDPISIRKQVLKTKLEHALITKDIPRLLEVICEMINLSSDAQMLATGWTYLLQFKRGAIPSAWVELRNGKCLMGTGELLFNTPKLKTKIKKYYLNIPIIIPRTAFPSILTSLRKLIPNLKVRYSIWGLPALLVLGIADVILCFFGNPVVWIPFVVLALYWFLMGYLFRK